MPHLPSTADFDGLLIPNPDAILDQISARRKEMRALQKLLKVSQAATERESVDTTAKASVSACTEDAHYDR